MRVIRDNIFQLNNETAVTIGKFDGIHRGHRELLDRILEKKSEGLEATVFTFDKSPAELFSGVSIPSLTTMEEKLRIFEHLGIDNVIVYPLNKESASIAPEDYITNILCKQMKMKYIVAGEDLSFGNRGEGNAALVERMSYANSDENKNDCVSQKTVNTSCCKLYDTEIIKKIIIDGDEVGSTLIREIVSNGDMERAAKLIGVPYAVSGVVSHGRKLGREMGFPTVNIEVTNEKLMPPFGVYFAEVSIDGAHYNGITNIGCKPTVTNSNKIFAETNIFDFNDDAYDKLITVKLLKFHRPEKKFASINELKRQIDMDIQKGKEFFL